MLNFYHRNIYRFPGQATAYYHGYLNMQGLHIPAELAQRKTFGQQYFHDFLLSQGLLQPEILKLAVLKEFMPSQL